MEIQPPLSTENSRRPTSLLKDRQKSEQRLFLGLLLLTLCLVPLMIVGAVHSSFGLIIVLLALPIVLFLVCCWPVLGFFLAMGATLVIDQSPLPLFASNVNIYVFYWPPQLQGLPDRPIGFFLLFVVLVVAIHNLLKRRKALEGGALLVPFLIFFVFVIWGIVHGMTTGGDLKVTVNEVRSFWYLLLGYLAAYNLVRTKKHLKLFFWFIIICAGIKAFEGVYIFLVIVHGDLSANHEIMSHEESYFWVGVVLLVMLFALFYKYRSQFYTALVLLPFLLLALVANNRRADFVALLIGLAIAVTLIFLLKPQIRRRLVILVVVTVLVGGGYVLAFYKQSGGFSEPARAIVSVFYTPPGDTGDASSNAYRDIEDYDLEYTVKQNPMGLGFGKPFLQPIPLPDISSDDPVYNLIPHNTIYWVWMRLGPLGYIALWYLFGAMIVRGCIYARQLKDRYLQLVAVYVVCMVIMEVIVAYADYQLSFYRNVLYVGMLAGILMRLPALDKEEEQSVHEHTRDNPRIPLSHVGGGSEELLFSQSPGKKSPGFVAQSH
jgi:hypothetical protein